MKRVKKRSVIEIVLLILIVIVIGFYFFNDGDFIEADISFEVKDLFLKINLNPGESSVYNVNIENLNKNLNEFSIKVNGLDEFISSSESLIINFNEEGVAKLNIQIPEDNDYGVFLGNLEVSLDGISKKVPIVLEVESEDILFDANIDLYPKGQALIKGERLMSEIKLFDLTNAGVREVELEYFVKDFDGRTIISEKESKTIDGRLDYSKGFEVPKDMKLEEYVLVIVVKYENSAGVSSVFFNVVDKDKTIFEFEDLSLIMILFLFFFRVFSL